MPALGLLLLPVAAPAEERIVEEIAAVVNGEAITRSDLEQAEQSMLRTLATKYSGDELKKIYEASKSGILDGMIEETPMERLFRETRLGPFSPISNEMVRNFVGERLGLARSY